MSRAKWKGPFVVNYLKPIEKDQRNPLIVARNSEIMPEFIGKIFSVHNGKIYSEITVTENHVGHKFGEFAITRAKFVFKKKKSKK
jgi:ribosomal protein S19